MRRTLVVTTPASDGSLLNALELRAAAGLAADDNSADTLLALQGTAAASALAAACKVAVGHGGQPTFRRETLTETLYATHFGWIGTRHPRYFPWTDRHDFFLSRRHAAVIDSITIDEAAVDGSEYVVDAESGRIEWINGGGRGQTIVIVYRAGFLLEQPTDAEDGADQVPDDLKYAATMMVQQLRAMIPATDRDPLVRAITVEGVGSVQYATDSLSTAAVRPLVPDYIMALLGRYRNMVAV